MTRSNNVTQYKIRKEPFKRTILPIEEESITIIVPSKNSKIVSSCNVLTSSHESVIYMMQKHMCIMDIIQLKTISKLYNTLITDIDIIDSMIRCTKDIITTLCLCAYNNKPKYMKIILDRYKSQICFSAIIALFSYFIFTNKHEITIVLIESVLDNIRQHSPQDIMVCLIKPPSCLEHFGCLHQHVIDHLNDECSYISKKIILHLACAANNITIVKYLMISL